MSAISDNKPRELRSFNYAVRLALPILWACAICWLSLTSNPPQISGVLGWDKLRDAVAYALLTILVAQYLYIHYADIWKVGLYAVCFAVLYGGLIEILQLVLQTGRSAEWWDLVADTVGSVAGCVIFRQAAVMRSQHHDQNDPHG